jgi:hypothetical protein
MAGTDRLSERRGCRWTALSLRWHALASIMATLIVAGCSLNGPPAPLPNPERRSFMGSMTPTCSPVDALAVQIDLVPADGSRWPSASISLWMTSLPNGPIVKNFTKRGGGQGAWCTGEGECLQATKGSVQFDGVDDAGWATGRFSLTAESGDSLRGAFRVRPQVDTPAICG